MNDDILFVYEPQANPQRQRIDGVPLANITARQWAKFTEPLREAVKKSGMYRQVQVQVVDRLPDGDEPDAAAPEELFPAQELVTPDAAAPQTKSKRK